MASRDIVVIGGSSGALEALRAFVGHLGPDFPAAIFIVIHTSPDSPGLLPQILNQSGRLPARFPDDGERFGPGRIYVAPPDRHLLLKREFVRVTRGPRENRFRPAVDPLFRTAAMAYGRRVVGIVLSGGQDDGAVGLAFIKRHGGVAVVQDPETALVPGMPEAALRHVAVDHVAGLHQLPGLLARLTSEPIPSVEAEMPDELPRDIAEVGGHAIHHAKQLGPPSPFTCPDCGGTLWQSQDGEMLQYQCHVGHRFSGDSLIGAQDEALDQALWTGLRALEESAELRRRMARHARERGLVAIARNYDEHAEESEVRAGVIRRVLMPEAQGEGDENTAPVSGRSGGGS